MSEGTVWDKCGTLPDHVIKKAEEELNETQEKSRTFPSLLRQRINERNDTDVGSKIQEICATRDDGFLRRYLRARKYNIEKAYGLLEGYVKLRQKYPELFQDLTTTGVIRSLESGFPGVLPDRDKHGRVVFIFNIGSWNAQEIPFDQVMRAYIYLLELLIENEETQISGFVLIENFANYSLSQAADIRPSDLRKMVNILQGSFPARFKAIHVIHEPWYFSWTYTIVKTFVKAKFIERVHVHGHTLDKFFSEFDPSYIPEDFSGTAPPYDPVTLVAKLPCNDTEEIFRSKETIRFDK